MANSYNAMLTGLERLKEADLIWTKAMQPTHRFIVWLANQNKLLTKERLQSHMGSNDIPYMAMARKELEDF